MSCSRGWNVPKLKPLIINAEKYDRTRIIEVERGNGLETKKKDDGVI